MRIALWQPAAAFPDREPMLAGLDRRMADAATAGCLLLVAPERLLAAEISPAGLAEPSDGELARALAARCREHGLGLVLGQIERYAGHLFASLMAFSPAGLALANYRRTHLRPEEKDRFDAGNWLTLFPFAGRRLALLGGPDLELPEPARVLALTGAEAILAAGGGGPEPAVLRALLATRARENRLPLVYADFAPPRGGGALAFDAAGRPAGGGVRGELLLVDLEPGEGPGTGPERRPELYARLTEIDA